MNAPLKDYLKTELQLELSAEKTLITHAQRRVRFLGYDIKKWDGERIRKVRTQHGIVTRRTCNQHFALLMPHDKCRTFARNYGNTVKWVGKSRTKLLHLSDLEILMSFNAEIRGFLGYYALTDNFTTLASKLLWLTTTSFLRTLADKHKSTLMKVAHNLKRGANTYVISVQHKGETRSYTLLSSTKQFARKKVMYGHIDVVPQTLMYRSRSELGQRLRAHQCEWCGTREGPIEVHHIRKLKDLKGKTVWERQMIERQRKTMVLCKDCHIELHAGTLSEGKKAKRDVGEPDTLKGVSPVRGELRHEVAH